MLAWGVMLAEKKVSPGGNDELVHADAFARAAIACTACFFSG
jgi:hypothetical protein